MPQQNEGQPDPRTALERLIPADPVAPPPPVALAPWVDWQAADAFLRTLGLDPSTIQLRAIFPNRGAGGAVKLLPGDFPNEAARLAQAEELHSRGYNLYFSANGGPKKDDVTACPVVFVEWDKRPIDWQITAWQELGLPQPTASVNTGGKSIHHHWRLDQPMAPTDWEAMIRRLIRVCGGDAACCDASRVMRLPGSHYWPRDNSLAKVLQPGQDPREHLKMARVFTELRPDGGGLRWPSQLFIDRCAAADPVDDPPPAVEVDAIRDLLKRHLPLLPDGEYREDTPDDVRDALACIPPRLPGTGTYPEYRNTLWGLRKVIEGMGGTAANAVQLMASHSPAWGLKAIRQVMSSGGEQISAGTFWHHAEEHGYVNKRGVTREQPPATPMPTPKQVEASPTLQQEMRQAAEALVMEGGRTLDLFAVFPRHLAQAMIDTAEVLPCDPQAFVLPLLCTAGSILGRKVVATSVKTLALGVPDENWREQVQVWGMNLGDASQGKSNSSGFFEKALHAWQAKLRRTHKAAEAQWAKDHTDAAVQSVGVDGEVIDAKTAQANWREDNPKPAPCRHVIVSDATLEVIGTYLSAPDCPGLVAFHDEMRSWFEALQRGGEGSASQRSQWLPLWQGAAVVTDRLGRENVFCKSSSISVFGNMQPKVLKVLRDREAKASGGEVLADGMWARFLMVVPESVPYSSLNTLVKRPRLDLAPIVKNTIVDGLESLVNLQQDDEGEIVPHAVDWDAAAAKLMHAQHCRWETLADAATEERGAWLTKLRGYSVRFALTLHCLSLAMQSVGTLDRLPPISADTARRALVLAEWFRSQYEGALPLFGGEVEGLPPPVAKLLRKAKGRGKKTCQRPVEVRDATRWRISGEQNRDKTVAVMAAAVQAGIGALAYEVCDGKQQVAAWLPPKLWPEGF